MKVSNFRIKYTNENREQEGSFYKFVELAIDATEVQALLYFSRYHQVDGYYIESVDKVHFEVPALHEEALEVDTFTSCEEASKMLAYYRQLFTRALNCVERENEYGRIFCLTANKTQGSSLIGIYATTNCFEGEKHFNETLLRLLKQEARKNVLGTI